MLAPAPHLPFDAETPGVIDDPFAHPCDGLGGSIRGVAEDGQSWGVEGGFANAIDSCGKHREGSVRLRLNSAEDSPQPPRNSSSPTGNDPWSWGLSPGELCVPASSWPSFLPPGQRG